MNPFLAVGVGVVLLVVALGRKASAAARDAAVRKAEEARKAAELRATMEQAIVEVARQIRAGTATPEQVAAGARLARALGYLRTAESFENIEAMIKLGDLDEATRSRLVIPVGGGRR